MLSMKSQVRLLRMLAIYIPDTPPVGERGEERAWILVEASVEVVLEEVEGYEGGEGEEVVLG